MSPSKYSERRKALVKFITAYVAEHGGSPSAATLSRRLGWSQNTCQGYLRRLGSELPLPASCRVRRDRYAFHRPRLLRLIQAFSARNGFAPTHRELASETGLSPTTLRRYLRRMQEEDWVDFQPGAARSLRVLKNLTAET
jgi:SOS-response transcriptional repressor LexA